MPAVRRLSSRSPYRCWSLCARRRRLWNHGRSTGGPRRRHPRRCRVRKSEPQRRQYCPDNPELDHDEKLRDRLHDILACAHGERVDLCTCANGSATSNGTCAGTCSVGTPPDTRVLEYVSVSATQTFSPLVSYATFGFRHRPAPRRSPGSNDGGAADAGRTSTTGGCRGGGDGRRDSNCTLRLPAPHLWHHRVRADLLDLEHDAARHRGGWALCHGRQSHDIRHRSAGVELQRYGIVFR
jgi:hypothetical protein